MPIDAGDGSSDMTREEARLFGYYIAEGSVWIGTSMGVAFSCNKNDVLVTEIDELIRDGSTIAEYQASGSDQAVNVTITSTNIALMCGGLAGRGVRNKIIPRQIYDTTAALKLEFAAAWFNGDGWQDKKGLHWSTYSRTLSIELQMLLASIGIPASVYRIDHTSDLPHGVKRTGDGIEYTVNVSNQFSDRFASISKATSKSYPTTKTTVRIVGNYLAIPVRAVELIEKRVTVHDVSVDEDESFTAFGFGVHNCKIAFDVCAGCSNQAKNRKEYCDTRPVKLAHRTVPACTRFGCKDGLTKVADDGFVQHVDNPDPLFWFDCSGVERNADRIAVSSGVLTKAANAAEIVGGAEMAERLSIIAPPRLLEVDPTVPAHVIRQVKLAVALAEAEDTLPANGWDLTQHHSVTEKIASFPDARPGEIFRALADAEVLLSPYDWLHLTVSKQAAEEANTEVAAQLPGIYTRFVADPTFEVLLADNAFVPQPNIAPAQVRCWAAKYAGALSIDHDLTYARVKLAAVRGAIIKPPTAFTKQAQELARDGAGAEKLAQQYALYQLAFLDALPDHRFASEMVLRSNTHFE
jgi:hypothetical protein